MLSPKVRWLLCSLEYIKFFFGTQKLKIYNNKIVETSGFYKIYSLFLLVCVPTIIINELLRYLNQAYGKTPTTVIVILVLTYTTQCFNYMVTLINGIFYSKILKKILENLMKIDCILEDVDFTFKLNFVFAIIIYFILKSAQILIDFVSWNLMLYRIMIIFYFMSNSLDFEILHFVIKLNIVAKQFEVLNQNLILYGLKNHNIELSDLERKSNILHKIWKNRLSNKRCESMHIDQILKVYKILLDTVDDLNSFYGLMVI